MKVKNEFAKDLEAFEKFLADFVHRNLISAYRIDFFPTLKDLRSQWGRSDLDHVSRTHKDVNDAVLGVEVIKVSGHRVGVDLETAGSLARPIFARPAFLTKRFGLDEKMSAKDILLEWVRREAAFKALHPFNQGVLLSEFQHEKRDSAESLLVAKSGTKIRVATLGSKLILGFAWVE